MADGAASYLPDRLSLASLRRAAAQCEGCPLHERATQTVFGEGLRRSRLLLYGEQPGDQEDRRGTPFVGPAGRTLDRAFEEAGIERDTCYVTNAVKHFKWRSRGRRRLHEKPSASEIEACFPWLEAEVEVVEPEVVVAMGATAARAAFGKAVRLKDHRGRFRETRLSPATLVTIHPSSVLRHPEREQRRAALAELVADLEKVRDRLGGS